MSLEDKTDETYNIIEVNRKKDGNSQEDDVITYVFQGVLGRGAFGTVIGVMYKNKRLALKSAQTEKGALALSREVHFLKIATGMYHMLSF